MNKKILFSCIISTSLGYSVSSAHAQADNWNDLSFDTPSNTHSTPPAPKMAIPDATQQKTVNSDTNLKVEAPKEIQSIDIPIPALPTPSIASSIANEQVIEPIAPEAPKAKVEKKTKPVSSKQARKSKARPVEIKESNAKKKVLPKRRMVESSTLSEVFETNEDLEVTYKPNSGLTRYKFENKTTPPKFFQKTEFSEENKHLPTVVYQKRYSELLFAAIQKDDIGAIGTLISNGADLNSKIADNGYSALMYAIQLKNLRTIRYLITKGADVNQQSNDGQTALHLAAHSGNSEVFTALIKTGAKPFLADYVGKFAVDYAPAPLKEQFETIVAQSEPNKLEALLSFVDKGSVRPVIKLIEQGVDINVRDKNGDTPLIKAVRKNDTNMANLLLSKGASTLVMNNSGENALGLAKQNENMQLATIIDTVTIKRELESGVSTKVTKPAYMSATELPQIAAPKHATHSKHNHATVSESPKHISPTPHAPAEPQILKSSVEAPIVTEQPMEITKTQEPQTEGGSWLNIFGKPNKAASKPVSTAPTPTNQEGFLSNISKSISSFSSQVTGSNSPATTPAVTASEAPTPAEIVTEKLPIINSTIQPETTTAIQTKPMTEVFNAKKAKMPSNIVKKTLVDGQIVGDEALKTDEAPLTDKIMSIFPKW